MILGLDNEGLLWIRYWGGGGAEGSQRLKGKKSKKSGVVSVRELDLGLEFVRPGCESQLCSLEAI